MTQSMRRYQSFILSPTSVYTMFQSTKFDVRIPYFQFVLIKFRRKSNEFFILVVFMQTPLSCPILSHALQFITTRNDCLFVVSFPSTQVHLLQ